MAHTDNGGQGWNWKEPRWPALCHCHQPTMRKSDHNNITSRNNFPQLILNMMVIQVTKKVQSGCGNNQCFEKKLDLIFFFQFIYPFFICSWLVLEWCRFVSMSPAWIHVPGNHTTLTWVSDIGNLHREQRQRRSHEFTKWHPAQQRAI